MKLETTCHTGRRVSYYTLVRITPSTTELTATVVDETGLWSAVVKVDDRLLQRLGGRFDTGEAYFYARIRGGEIDLHDQELNPEWDEPDERV